MVGVTHFHVKISYMIPRKSYMILRRQTLDVKAKFPWPDAGRNTCDAKVQPNNGVVASKAYGKKHGDNISERGMDHDFIRDHNA
jgi:hypothetical protein